MMNCIESGKELKSMDVQIIAETIFNGISHDVNHLYKKAVGRSYEHKLIYPKTIGQKQLLDALMSKDMIFVSGPAGTGKTFLSVVYAVTQLRNEEVRRLIVTRPVVEAGENLGFLPGDLKEKVDPYLRPIYDALYFTLGQVQTERLLEKGIIEIAPLAYMRGRTLDDAIIILDEAQNTTPMQMKMFLTRMGFDSKMIITGDMTQIDLPSSKGSGFIDALNRLQGIDEIGFVHLHNSDVVRHPLVKKILTQYDDQK
ncbi:MAG: PhoH family protein [Erysipelotrichaceae bacterium]|nr:PhoH family protein [Erysipelotrichaceae bacterium]MBQ9841321.1 PhoH family protein [Erysipelotrichaceae bacterium]